MRFIKAISLNAGLVALLSGCAGIPELYKPASTTRDDPTLAPKVDHIVERIRCELARVSSYQLKGKDYVITVLLTLQVNDELNLTPTLSFITPLKGTNTRTVSEGLGIGGARERMFTSTFTFNSLDLARQKACDDMPKPYYRLDGDLGLADIARDGIGIGNLQDAAQAPTTDGTAPRPNQPSFASQIKFVVTRSVSALGPTWSLVRFKGPGGANGLLNGKALTTDSVNVAFAVKKDPGPDLATKDQLDNLIRLIETLRSRERDAEGALARKKSARDGLAATKSNGLRPLSTLDMLLIQRADNEVATAEAARRDATALREQTEAALNAAKGAIASAQTRSQADALAQGRDLINTMILQNLNVVLQ
jgi:hypothetical protein